MKFLATVAVLFLFAGAAMAKDRTAQIKVKGMTCGACAVSVKKALLKTEGVKSAEVSLEKQLATVVYDDSRVSDQQLREAINSAGFQADKDRK